FWGLNGFFNWVKIKPVAPAIENFVQACIETKFIMPTVKMIEIFFGLFLILGFMIPLSLAVFCPILFVITGLHVFHNPKPWGILLSFTIPFLVLLILYRSAFFEL
ncbi:MAG: hypothetical protein ACXVCL_18910, partial [Bdellovibrio sp.]